MWFIGVEVEQEKISAHPPKKNPGSAPECDILFVHIKLTCILT